MLITKYKNKEIPVSLYLLHHLELKIKQPMIRMPFTKWDDWEFTMEYINDRQWLDTFTSLDKEMRDKIWKVHLEKPEFELLEGKTEVEMYAIWIFGILKKGALAEKLFGYMHPELIKPNTLLDRRGIDFIDDNKKIIYQLKWMFWNKPKLVNYKGYKQVNLDVWDILDQVERGQW